MGPLWVGVGLAVLAAAGLAAGLWSVFSTVVMGPLALSPAVLAGACWGGQLAYVGYSLGRVGIDEGIWRELLGFANALTLLRGALYAVVAGFAVVPSGGPLAWGPALCYGVGAGLDKLDGTVARTMGEETALGERLDTAFDTFGFVAAPVVAVVWGRLPVWYLSLSAARYVFLAGIRWRRLRGRRVYERPESDLGRYLAGVQMAFITVALVPVVPVGLVWSAAPVVLAPSLTVFARDYLAVSGRLPDRLR